MLGIYLLLFIVICCLVYLTHIIYNMRSVMIKFEEGLTIIAEKYFSLDENLSNLFEEIGENTDDK